MKLLTAEDAKKLAIVNEHSLCSIFAEIKIRASKGFSYMRCSFLLSHYKKNQLRDLGYKVGFNYDLRGHDIFW